MAICFTEACEQALSGVRLLRRPPLLCDESLRGYVQRVFDENGIPPMQPVMYSHAKLSEAIDWIAEVTGQSRARLLGRLSLTQHQKGKVSIANFAGQLIPGRWISGDQKRICPMCFRERPYMRIYWEFKVIKRCAIHACKLVDRCSNCSDQLRWSSGLLQSCKCGFVLQELIFEKANREIIEALYFNSLRSILRSESRITCPTSYSRSVSDPIHTVARITELLSTKYSYRKGSDSTNSPFLDLISHEQGHPQYNCFVRPFKDNVRLERPPTGLEATDSLVMHCFMGDTRLRPFCFGGDDLEFLASLASEVLGLAINAEPLVFVKETISNNLHFQNERNRSKSFLQSPMQLWLSIIRMWTETARQDLSA